MRNENPSWGQQSPPTIWDEQSTWRSAPVVPSVENRDLSIQGGSLVGAAGHLAVITSGAEIAGNTDPFVKSIN